MIKYLYQALVSYFYRIFNVKRLLCYVVFALLAQQRLFALDLVDSFQKALQYNDNFLSAIATRDAMDEKPVQSFASLLPQIYLTASMSENSLNIAGINIDYHQPTISAEVQQTLLDFVKTYMYDKSKFSSQKSDLEFELAKQQLIISVIQAYLNVLYSTDSFDIGRDILENEIMQTNKASIKSRIYRVNEAESVDANVKFDLQKTQEVVLENNLRTAKSAFQNITGANPDLIQPLVNELNITNIRPLQSWIQLANSNNLSIKIAMADASMAKEDIEIAKAKNMPTISIVGYSQIYANPSIDSSSSSTATAETIINQGVGAVGNYSTIGIELQVNIPIYSGGEITSQMRQAIDNYESAMSQLESIKQNVNISVKDIYFKLDNSINNLHISLQKLTLAKSKLKMGVKSLNNGFLDRIQAKTTETEYYNAIQAYNQARYQYIINYAQLLYIAGVINEDSLKEMNANVSY